MSGDDIDDGPTQAREYGSNSQHVLDNQTLGDEMDSAGISWAFYASTGTATAASGAPTRTSNTFTTDTDWGKDIISPQTNSSTTSEREPSRPSWVTPTCGNSDHAGCNCNTGPSWVASLVNAIGESQYWNNTAIFIFWDDYGGWFDPEGAEDVDYDGLGMRIPMLIVSAYAKKTSTTRPSSTAAS